MANYCDKCGAAIKSDDLFCNSCGSQLAGSKVGIGSEQSEITPPQQQPYYQTRPRKYYRSREDRWISGVCGGLGEYFDIDPLLIRLAFIFFGLFWLYIILALVVEENPYQTPRYTKT